jgi:ribonuclease BN (tRNA processing enzyme)
VRATLLGSGGWLPTDRRETACLLLHDGGHALVLDAGTGLRRLVTDPSLLDGVERLSVVLTHFHLDHVCGLAAAPALSEREVEIRAPARLLGHGSALSLVERLLGPPFLAGTSERLRSWLPDVRELEATQSIGPFEVATRVQPQHPGSSVAIRVGNMLALCTDTAYDPENVPFASGVRVLLHEAFHRGEQTDDPTHAAAGEAARVAAAAEAEQLVLVHVKPTETDDGALLDAARAIFPPSLVATDGLELAVG